MSIESKLLSIAMQMGLPNNGLDVQEAVPFALIAPPGTSKTAAVTSVSKGLAEQLKEDFPTETVALPQTMPENLGGCPVPNWDEKVMELFVLRVGAALKRAGQGVLFLDELTSAPVPVGAAAQTAIQNGKLGDFLLPPSVARGVAMNDPETATAGRPLSSAESNRFFWIDWTLDFDDWEDYMFGGAGVGKGTVLLPDNWEADYYHRAAFLVVSFCRKFPQHFLTEPAPHDSTRPWPSPRSWRNASRLLAACFSLGFSPSSTECTKAIEGCVGNAVAIEFLTYMKDLDIPDPEEVLKNPTSFRLPNRDDKLLAALTAVVEAGCLSKYTGDEFVNRWKAAVTVCERFERKKDLLMTLSQYLLSHYPQGAEMPNLAAWYHDMNVSTGLVSS